MTEPMTSEATTDGVTDSAYARGGREAHGERLQYLTFRLGDEIFAMEIFKVREVLEYRRVTRVPRTPPYMRGVINLRGNVVPVVDLHVKFGHPPTEVTADTCIVITEVDFGGESVMLGALADSVDEVFELETSQIEPPPRLGHQLRTEFIKGMGKKGEEFVIIFDVDRVFSLEDLEHARSTQVAAAGAARGA